MKSSSNAYLSNLDHLRAFAAFMVFIWHFIHFSPRCPTGECIEAHMMAGPFFSLLEQGYTGVALFMCISGYIFTYLTDGYRLHLPRFWLNRIVRLFPLVIVWGLTESIPDLMDLYYATNPVDIQRMLHRIFHPQGAWTIYLELQYYIALPFILLCVRRYGVKTLAFFLLALMAFRYAYWFTTGSVQYISYWTIGGRADQFLLGMMAFYLEKRIKNGRGKGFCFALLGVTGAAGIIGLYHIINQLGGVYAIDASMLWVFLPTLEGMCYALVIIAYLQCRVPRPLDGFLSPLGKWSYSLYLDHFQLLPFLGIFAITRFGMGDDFTQRLMIASFLIFPLLALFAAATYMLIEKPFLRLRRNYLLPLR